jgi:molybdopterin-guanine dinucleotide biosynthesis protein A
MGRDKALLPYRGTTFLAHAVARLRTACDEVYVLSGARARYEGEGVPVLTDRGVGPLGAILAGLERAPAGLFLAVDIPLVPEGLLALLTRRLPGYDAVVPLSPGGPEPLCAAYGPACREAILARIERGERKAAAFFEDVRVLYLEPGELAPFGDPGEIFRNVNRPEELPPDALA